MPPAMSEAPSASGVPPPAAGQELPIEGKTVKALTLLSLKRTFDLFAGNFGQKAAADEARCASFRGCVHAFHVFPKSRLWWPSSVCLVALNLATPGAVPLALTEIVRTVVQSAGEDSVQNPRRVPGSEGLQAA